MEDDPYRPVDLRGQRAMIAGGTTGVGRATAALLASKGCRVFICGRDAGALRKAIETVSGAGGEISGVTADLAEVEGVLAFFRAADDWLGGLDIAVLNAGVGSNGELTKVSHEECRQVVNVNLLSVIHCAREALLRMSGKGGQIVMTGSMSAEVFDAPAALYTATKAGIRGFAGSLRKEANPLGVRVSLLEPGSIGTDMVDESLEEQRRMQDEMRMLRAEDVARSILFVLTQPPRCDIITLQVRPHLQII